MSIFVDVATNIRIAKNTQYLASDIIAKLKKTNGLIDTDYPTLIRIVRKSLNWANGETASIVTGDGDFLAGDFLAGDFSTGETVITTTIDARDGVDIVANYLYALCGKYAQLAAVINEIDCVPVWGIEFGAEFSCSGGDSPIPTIGIFAYEFNNIFN